MQYASQGKISDLPETPKGECGCMPGRALGKPRDAGDKGAIESCAGCSRNYAGKCGARGWQFLHQAGVARSAQVWLSRVVSASLRSCVKTSWWRAGQTSLTSCLGRTRSAVLSLEEWRSEVKRLRHEVQGCRPCATCVVTNRRPLPSHYRSGRRWRGKRIHSVEMPSEENRGVTRWEAMQH